MDLCLLEELSPDSRVSKWWWDKDGLELEGIQKADQQVERTEVEEEVDGTEMGTD